MASFYDLTIGQNIEFQRILVSAGLTAEDGKSVIDNPSRASKMIMALHEPPIYLLPSWYVQPDQQIERVTEFLEVHGGGSGFTPSDIPPAPTDFVPRTPTEVLILMVYLPDKARSAQRTFDNLWDFVAPPDGYPKWRWDSLKSDSKNLRYLPGIKHAFGIRWVAFDPNANHGKSPKSCWEDKSVASTLASAEVLMALALFPKWYSSWDGNKSPYPNMAGYQFKWEAAWQRCPYVDRRVGSRLLGLFAGSAGSASGVWSSPSVREC